MVPSRRLVLLCFCLFLLAAGSEAISTHVGAHTSKLSSPDAQFAEIERLQDLGLNDAHHHQLSRPSPSSTSSPRWPLTPRPVQVTLYGEARCPFCADWIVKNAQKLIDEIGDIIEFKTVEFGNARRNESTGELSCQHGPSECEANAVFACTRAAFEKEYRWLRVVSCSEKDVFEHAADPLDSFDACVVEEVKRAGSPFEEEEGERKEEEKKREVALASSSSDDDDDDPDDDEKIGKAVAARLRACASGDEGASLIAEAEQETASLVPKHTFVPWVVVDGLPLGDASLETARSVACAAWRGKREERPEACLAAPGLGLGLGRERSSIF